jgi:hypothetical protein
MDDPTLGDRIDAEAAIWAEKVAELICKGLPNLLHLHVVKDWELHRNKVCSLIRSESYHVFITLTELYILERRV